MKQDNTPVEYVYWKGNLYKIGAELYNSILHENDKDRIITAHRHIPVSTELQSLWKDGERKIEGKDFRIMKYCDSLNFDTLEITKGNLKALPVPSENKATLPPVQEKITEEHIDNYIADMMKSDPVKFVQYCLVIIGRDILKTNATDFTFSQECDLEEGRRFKVSVKGKIKELKK